MQPINCLFSLFDISLFTREHNQEYLNFQIKQQKQSSKMFLFSKYAANLQENIHAEVKFQ